MKGDAFGSEAECEDCGWQEWVEDLPIKGDIDLNCCPSCGSIHIYELDDEDEVARLEAELPEIGRTGTVAIFIPKRHK